MSCCGQPSSAPPAPTPCLGWRLAGKGVARAVRRRGLPLSSFRLHARPHPGQGWLRYAPAVRNDRGGLGSAARLAAYSRSPASGRLAPWHRGFGLKACDAFLQRTVNRRAGHGLAGGKLRFALVKNCQPARRRVVGSVVHDHTIGPEAGAFQRDVYNTQSPVCRRHCGPACNANGDTH